MTDEERTRLAKMEEKLNSVDSRVSRIESKMDLFLETQEQRHFELMTHSSAETSKVSVEFGKKMADQEAEMQKKLDEKADKVYETFAKIVIVGLLTGGLSAIGYAVIHAYTNSK